MTNIFNRTKNRIYEFDGRSEKNKRLDYFIAYTVAFAILCIAVYSFYWLSGKSFVNDTDGTTQHYNSFMYFGVWVREILRNLFSGNGFQVPVWNFGIGYGGDVITTLNYYAIGDPLNLLSIFVPAKYAVHLYNALVIVRLYLAGVAFSCFCFRMKCDRTSAFIGSIAYVFCGYSLFIGQFHPFFLNPMIYFPLLLIGAERILHREKPTLFIVMIFISAISNFYFFYMIVALAVIYVIFRFFMIYKERRLKNFAACFVKFLGYGVVGVMMSAIILLPILIVYTGDARSAISTLVYPLYEWDYYAKFFNYFIGGIQEVGGPYTFLGYVPVVLLSILLMFKKKKKHTALKIGFILLTLMLFIPFFGSFFNGFSYVTNRWVWAYSFLCAFILAIMWKELVNVTKGEAVFLTGASFIYVLICIILLEGNIRMRGAIFFTIFAICALLILAFTTLKRFSGKKIAIFLKSSLLCVMSFVSIFISAAIKYAPSEDNYIRFNHYTDDAYDILTKSKDIAVKEAMEDSGSDGQFSRMGLYGNYDLNSTLLTGMPSTQFYWSLGNGSISAFMKDLDLLRNLNFSYYNLDERAYLNALASVEYYVVKNGDQSATIPYGYEKIGTYFVNQEYVDKKYAEKENELGRKLTDKERSAVKDQYAKIYDVYKTDLTLPLGYTYSQYFMRDEFDGMPSEDRQEAMLSAVMLEDDAKNIGKAELKLTNGQKDYEIICAEGVKFKDGKFVASKSNASVTLRFKGDTNSETYFKIEGLYYSNKGKIDRNSSIDYPIYVKCGEVSKNLIYYTPVYKWYAGRHDFIVNMGYSEEEKDEITLTFKTTGEYAFDKISIVEQPMDNFQELIDERTEDILEDVEILTNAVKGKINLSADKFLCLSIPYSEGWTAYVDGQEVELKKANGMYMGMELEAGEHEIELKYMTPGLKAGALCSLVGIILIISISIYHRKRNKKILLDKEKEV